MEQNPLRKNILIVDDTPENLTILRHILAEAGYRVRPALSGEIALKTIQADLPDLILLDILMPGMSGYDVCAELKAREATRDVPVIFISALDKIEDKVRAFTEGGVDYISKPFHAGEVLARVNAHLMLRGLQKKLEEKNARLQKALDEIKTLKGILPICASCKKIRDDKGYWNQIESYIRDHSDADFSHGICPDCVQKLYPHLNVSNRIKKESEEP